MDIHLSIIVHCVNMPIHTVDVVLARRFRAAKANGWMFSVKVVIKMWKRVILIGAIQILTILSTLE